MTAVNSLFRTTRRAAEQSVELVIGHGGAAQKIEEVKIQPKRAVRLDFYQFPADRIGKFRFAVWRQAHEFVFTGVDAEAAIVRERGIKQPE